MFKCLKCGSEIILVESMADEETTRWDYECPNCGLDYEEDRSNYEEGGESIPL